MSLSCSCNIADPYDCDYWVDFPNDYSAMPHFARRKRCCSCGVLINTGETVNRFARTRAAQTDIEEKIYGEGPDTIHLCDWYMCETCSDLWYSFHELGFECVMPDENMHDLLKEYTQL